MDFLVGFGQLCLSSNHIAGFSDHQYLCKESIDTLDFLHEDNLQRKEGSETTTFGWVLLIVILIQSDYRIL